MFALNLPSTMNDTLRGHTDRPAPISIGGKELPLKGSSISLEPQRTLSESEPASLNTRTATIAGHN